ncbi:MAG: hypothetical protein HY401_04105 [Elusimicrobia bacterium]|nr:hypothetical protein [Elusimicrobiota bacterium]
MEPITAQTLKERLKKEKTIEVGGIHFRIRKVPLLLLAEESDDLWGLARQGKDVLAGKIKDLIASPSLSRIRRVLLAGVAQPKLSVIHEEESVCVDLIMADSELSTGLFLAVVNFSLEA